MAGMQYRSFVMGRTFIIIILQQLDTIRLYFLLENMKWYNINILNFQTLILDLHKSIKRHKKVKMTLHNKKIVVQHFQPSIGNETYHTYSEYYDYTLSTFYSSLYQAITYEISR